MRTRRNAQPGLGLVVLSWLAGVVSANEQFTSTPANFRGFQLYANGAIETISCADSATFFMSSTYGACCYPGERCNFATACEGGTASRIFGGTYTCDSAYPNCYTMTVYASYPSASDSWLVRGCATNWKAFTIYREIVTSTSQSTTTTAITGPSAPTVTPPVTGSSASGATAGAVTGPSSPTNTAETTATAAPSQAWIAGAVIGPLVAVAGLGLLAFWLGKRKGQKGTSAIAAPPPGPFVGDRTSVYPGYNHASSPGPEGKPFVSHDVSAASSTSTGYGFAQPPPGYPPVQYAEKYPGQPPMPQPMPSMQVAQAPAHYPAQLPSPDPFPNPAYTAELPHDPAHR